ncbi:MAG: hypothetical protein UZ16_OP3001001046 [Candidatus Hinthialibacteria bacterium OLB16]|nr:MAG: hypothetical protein UZ16_OP3001001046 [Candidatus Hinthialibacteria bacterium OLB16]
MAISKTIQQTLIVYLIGSKDVSLSFFLSENEKKRSPPGGENSANWKGTGHHLRGR